MKTALHRRRRRIGPEDAADLVAGSLPDVS